MTAPIDVTNIRIGTPRLLLRAWRETDLEDFYAYASVPGVGEMAGWRHHESREVSREILERFIAGKRTFALEEKETGRVIGSLGLEERDWGELGSLRGREIGYVLSKDCWGQGLMPEAVRAVCDYCFRALHFDYLTCGHFTGNRQSQRVIEKCGFRFWKEISFTTAMGTEEKTKLYLRTDRRHSNGI